MRSTTSPGGRMRPSRVVSAPTGGSVSTSGSPVLLLAVLAGVLSTVLVAVGAAPVLAAPEPGGSRTSGSSEGVPGSAPTIAEVQRAISALESSMEVVSERTNRAQVHLDRTRAEVRRVKGRIVAAEAEVRAAQTRVDLLAAEIYRQGSIDPSLAFLAADDPTEFLQRASAVGALTASQAAVLEDHRAAADSLARLRDVAVEREQQAAALYERVVAERGRLSALLNRQEQILAGLREDERRRLEAAEQSARQAQLAAAGLAMEALGPSAATGADIPADQKGQQAVRFALAQVGKAYVWGAEGPDAFDCSGLTMMAWRSAGVRFDHFSGLQYEQTRHVSAERLKPGDLLFFYHVNKHVGMYVGDGKIVHAANSRRGVVMDDLAGYYRANLVAVTRPAG